SQVGPLHAGRADVLRIGLAVDLDALATMHTGGLYRPEWSDFRMASMAATRAKARGRVLSAQDSHSVHAETRRHRAARGLSGCGDVGVSGQSRRASRRMCGSVGLTSLTSPIR